jgi:DNA-binding CsgD family transcriptional regulator
MATATAHVVGPLLERDEELAQLARCLDQAATGRGRLVVVEGPAGIGKTRIVRAAEHEARRRGFRVLAARCSDLGDLAYGAVRDLFQPALRDPDVRRDPLEGPAALAQSVLAPARFGAAIEPGAAGVAPDASLPALHGLWWLCVNLCESSPILVSVDDVQWADPASLRFLNHLAARLDEVPIAVVAGVRSGHIRAEPLLAELLSAPFADVLRLTPLSERAVALLVHASPLRGAPQDFVLALHEATGGNAYLLEEVLADLNDRGVRAPDASSATLRGLAPPKIVRSLLARLSRLRPPSQRLAQAVAVLDRDVQLRHAALLAGLPLEEAARAADLLAASGILRAERPVEFVHPIVREAVYSNLPTGERALAHRRAARLLSADGAPLEDVATHLVRSEPADEEWTVEVLRHAAADALVRGAPDTAVSYLRRSLAEPPPQSDRWRVLWELGLATARSDPESSVGYLREAHARAPTAGDQARICLALLQALATTGRVAEAEGPTLQSIAALGGTDPELALRLEAELATAERQGSARSPLIERRLQRWSRVSGTSPAERVVLAHVAVHRALTGASAETVAELAGRALGGERLLEDQTSESLLAYLPLYPLLCADRFDDVARYLEAALDDARARGSLHGFVLTSVFRSHLAYARGDLHDAESEGVQAMDAASGVRGWRLALPGGLEPLLSTLVELGDLAGADDLFKRHGCDGHLPDSVPFRLLLASRGRLRLAQGRIEAAVADFEELEDREQRGGAANLYLHPHRVDAALAHAHLGRAGRAGALIDDELDRARAWGTPRMLGLTLRAAGLVHRGARGLDLLRESVHVLEQSPAKLARAHALVDLGAALRRAGGRRDAVDPLREGMDLSHRCGATPLVERARSELLLLGARPRRPATTGVEALTASERRVAELAAQGLTNREIAEALFITVGTVEVHLTHTYQKLGIGSRRDLSSRLESAARRVP